MQATSEFIHLWHSKILSQLSNGKEYFFISSSLPSYPWFYFLRLQLPVVNHGLKVLYRKFQGKKIINFKFCAILSKVV